MRKRTYRMQGKRLCILFFVSVIFSSAVTASSAEVYFSKNGTGSADTVYVAGNPDFYPIEYYNSKTNSYEGILPKLFESVSDTTELDFTYIHTGNTDQRERLAKNGQVEIVSSYLPAEEDMEEYLSGTEIVFSVPIDGKEQDVCLAFTYIASDELIDTIASEISNIPDSQFISFTISSALEQHQWRSPLWIILLLSVILIFAIIAVILLLIQLNRKKKEKRKNDFLDPTTGIGNKVYFTYYFENSISDQARNLYFIAYIAFDIAYTNKYYGYNESENILRFAADILSRNAADTDITARVTAGGFALAFQSSNHTQAREHTEHLLHLLNQYGETFNRDFRIDFCAGIYPLSQSDRSCETALYYALQGYQHAVLHQSSCSFVDEGRRSHADETAQLQKQIVSALKKQEFKMYLQFIVNKDTGEICGAEALSRWQHPQKGLLSPVEYIDVMEKLGNICELDFYIFEKACRQLQLWQSKGLGRLSLSCNFTRITISSAGFMDRIHTIIERIPFNHANLIIEITEDTTESNEEVAFHNIIECKKAGFLISLDDFGEGHTSFQNWCDYPLDYVKIDKSIVRKADTSKGKDLLNGMIALGHSMNMKILCEGVETEQLNDLICQTKCDFIQGYYYSRTIPQEESTEFLKKHGIVAK